MADHVQGRSTDEPVERDSKRRRVTRACDICKSRKRRCTGDVPCTACTAYSVKCTYLSSYNRGKPTDPSPSGRVASVHQAQSNALPDNAIAGAEPAQHQLDADGSLITATGAFAGQYLGPSSPYSFLRRAWKRFGTQEERHIGSDDATDQATRSGTGSIFQYGDRRLSAHDREGCSSTRTYNIRTVMSRYFELASPTYRLSLIHI